MKQIEITVKVKEAMQSAIEKLEMQGYKKIRESDVADIYMTQLKSKLNKDNIKEILSSCVLLRTIKIDEKEVKKITYKNKEYDNGQVISEQKVNIDCNNLEDAKKLFEYLNFEELIEVKYHVLVMEKDGIELAFQDVENLGLLIEYENNNNFENKTIEEIKEEKIKMYKEIKKLGIKITEDYDIKKAWELIVKKYL